MKWWRVPANGPSNPRERIRRIKSFRLHGDQGLTAGLSVQIDRIDDGKSMPEFQAQDDPVFEGGAELVLAAFQGFREGDNALALRDAAYKGVILKLVIFRQGHRGVYIVR